ncbi:hypothetical protein M8Z33_42100 [Streptomyces sp. ZAF1911]|uniref:hypothetical protein n=1 Tax=Streptomyces sp. ZAF1911 TaxID=2944129 RepID=UPI00237C18C7|nr:hypothetical protein [Streptomyces sp. ZAF1911]MDD9383132.1 hypothetical protein [Streptomyces sp. ZAF1911]
MIRRLRRPRSPRCLAGTEPYTITRLPGSPRPLDAEQPPPPTGSTATTPIQRAEPEPDDGELAVKAWLHQYGHRRDTGFRAAAEQL